MKNFINALLELCGFYELSLEKRKLLLMFLDKVLDKIIDDFHD